MEKEELHKRLRVIANLFRKDEDIIAATDEELLDYISTAVNYILFDNEALNREIKVLKKIK